MINYAHRYMLMIVSGSSSSSSSNSKDDGNNLCPKGGGAKHKPGASCEGRRGRRFFQAMQMSLLRFSDLKS